jgi:hypothetical protein
MAYQFKLESSKTYASEANVVKAVEKYTPSNALRYFIACNAKGRFFPVFVGQSALTEQVHFVFPVVA